MSTHGAQGMGTRSSAVDRALAHFDDGGFKSHLAELVAIPSTSQDPGHEADLRRYLDQAMRGWLERMGFTVEIHPNPMPGFGPILLAERIENGGPDHSDLRPWRYGARDWRTSGGRG